MLNQLKSGKLNGATTFKYSGNLIELPDELYTIADTLEVLDLSGNKLSNLPDDFTRFKKLKIVFFSDNLFTEFPEVLGKCSQLEMIGFKANKINTIEENTIPINCRWLILTNNQISKLPNSIGNCSKLQKVMLAGNKLIFLPDAMSACKNIELLRISANELNKIPDWLFSLPRLSWLALAENPCSKMLKAKYDLTKISWGEIKLNEKLGEGASGIISKAKLKEKEVAVKIFKDGITSDGLPETEMQACVVAGKHSNLTKVLGIIENHIEKRNGLVLELIPPEYRNLGNPPSFETCTRDTFDENIRFTISEILQISLGIASAMVHLHNNGIMHGDLYAHNILINKKANPLLGDFGAATIYDINSPFAINYEKTDVRAFGCLLEDLLKLSFDKNKHTQLLNELEILKTNCLDSESKKRPTFSSIYNLLNSLITISSK
jgi:hypothetical protein